MVLFGATGDLARRKLLPGLFHLAQAGLLPECRIVGTSLDDLDDDGFRAYARGALDEFAHHGVPDDDWDDFSSRLFYVCQSAGNEALAEDRRRARGRARRRRRAPALPERPARGRARGGASSSARSGLAERRAHHHGEAVRHRPRERGEAERRAARDVRREPDLPHRPLPRARKPRSTSSRSGSRTGSSSRSGTASTSRTCRSTCPRRSRSGSASAFYEKTGAYRDMVVNHLFQVLAFMAMEPPTALEPRSIGEEKNKVFRSLSPIEPSQVVRGQYDGYLDEPGVRAALRDRDVHRAALRDRQLALGRRAVLPAHRQAHGRRRAHHLDRVPRAAEEHVPDRLGRRRARPRPPHLRPRRRVEALAVVLRQAARPGHDGSTSRACSSRCTRPAAPTDLLEAYERLIYDAMSGDHTLFTQRGGHRAAVGAVEAAAREPAAGAAVPAGLVGTRTRSTS